MHFNGRKLRHASRSLPLTITLFLPLSLALTETKSKRRNKYLIVVGLECKTAAFVQLLFLAACWNRLLHALLAKWYRIQFVHVCVNRYRYSVIGMIYQAKTSTLLNFASNWSLQKKKILKKKNNVIINRYIYIYIDFYRKSLL